jgi:hypothetical protein
MGIRGVFLLLSCMVGTLGVAGASEALEIDFSGLKAMDSASQTQVRNFIEATYQKLPARLREHFSGGTGIGPTEIRISFSQLSGETPLPPLECPVIDDMGPAQRLRGLYRDQRKRLGLRNEEPSGIRYDGGVYSVFQWDSSSRRSNIELHPDLAAMMIGKSTPAQRLSCRGTTSATTAQETLVHNFARSYDASRFSGAVERDYVTDPKSTCTSLDPKLITPQNRLIWSPAVLECVDLHESLTSVSERKRYRVLAGDWDGRPGQYDKTRFAVWPRAVNPYAFAGDVQTHFAYHMEKFLLDPEFACRMPLLHEYLSAQFGDPFDAILTGRCEVNTTIRLLTSEPDDSGTKTLKLQEYNLNPGNIAGIQYFRAGQGDGGISSAFGHSMYRLVAKTDGNFSGPRCDKEMCDLIFNHRATSREMRMDNGRAAFGGYPSQLLVAPVDEILEEYGDGELRDVYNIPLGRMTDKGFEPMSDLDKRRFVYAGLEQYWTYLGRYTFLSNNCADEAMRLFSISTDHPGMQFANILTPADINQKVFEKLGFTDPNFMKSVREPSILNRAVDKISFWEKWNGQNRREYEKRWKAIDSNPLVEKSRRYELYRGIADLFNLERRWLNGDAKDKPLDVDRVRKELKSWIELATVAKKADDTCQVNGAALTQEQKVALADSRIRMFRDRYDRLMSKMAGEFSRTKKREVWEDMYRLNQIYFLSMYYADRQRQKGIGELAVGLAYKIGAPSGKPEDLCVSGMDQEFDEARPKLIRQRIEQYRQFEMELQPYAAVSVQPGYGIPLEKDLTPGRVLQVKANAQLVRQRELVELLRNEIGVDYLIWFRVKQFAKDLCEERIAKNLIKDEAPNCQLLFPEVYAIEAQKGKTP